MRVMLLSAGTALSAGRLAEIREALVAAGSGPVDLDLFVWRAMESRAGLRSATVLGPTTTYVPPAPKPPAATSPVPTARATTPAGTPAAGRTISAEQAMAPPEDPSSDPAEDADGPSTAAALLTEVADAAPVAVRKAAGTVRWGTKRKIIQVRRSKPYQAVRRTIRGGVARQFAARAHRDSAVLACARNSQVIVALDSGAVAAAWWIAKRVPGPPVVFGLPAAERELRAMTRHPSTGAGQSPVS